MSTALRILKVSYETVRKIAKGLDRYAHKRKREGRTTADNELGPRTGSVVTTRPLERVEIDHFLLDVHLLVPVEDDEFIVQRPWLTLVIDHYSGVVLGYHLSFRSPCTASVLAALRHAMLPKTPTLAQAA